MSRVKNVRMVNKEELGNFKELGQMFEKMTGIHEQAEPDIVGPKMSEAYNFIIKWLKLMKLFCRSGLIQLIPIYFTEVDKIEEFVKSAEAELRLDMEREYISSDMFDEIAFYQAQIKDDKKVMEDIGKNLFDKYEFLKKSHTVMNIINTCSNLKPYAASLFAAAKYDENNISKYSRYHPQYRSGPLPNGDPRFLNEIECLRPIYFADMIDFKMLWIKGQMDKTRKQFLLKILFQIYYYGSVIFDIITSPDIDTEKMSQLFVDAIQAARKKLSGFDKAFELIENATDLLNKNFNTYYRESHLNGKNSTVFFENFIIDVANSQKEDNIARSQLLRLAAKLKDMIMQSADYKNNDVVQKLVNIMSDTIAKST